MSNLDLLVDDVNDERVILRCATIRIDIASTDCGNSVSFFQEGALISEALVPHAPGEVA